MSDETIKTPFGVQASEATIVDLFVVQLAAGRDRILTVEAATDIYQDAMLLARVREVLMCGPASENIESFEHVMHWGRLSGSRPARSNDTGDQSDMDSDYDMDRYSAV